MTGLAVILGNGRSRLTWQMSGRDCMTVGCNAIYRDTCVDALVAVDPAMCEEILSAPGSHETWLADRTVPPGQRRIYRRAGRRLATEIGSDPGMSAGPLAGWLLPSVYYVGDVWLVGMDMYSPNDRVNNVYAGTANYVATDAKAPTWVNWAEQWSQVFARWPHVTWRWRRPWADAPMPPQWIGIGNIKPMPHDWQGQ